MADSIRIKGGTGSVPKLEDRELGYSKDEKALYIGTKDGNVRLCGADDIDTVKAYIDGLVAQINARIDTMTTSE